MIKIFIFVFTLSAIICGVLFAGGLFGKFKYSDSGRQKSEIFLENQKEGTDEWKKGAFGNQTESTSVEWTDNKSIYGYGGLTSVNAGDSIDLKISTLDDSYSIDIYRMGWYGGKGATIVAKINDLKGQKYEILPPSKDTGLVVLNWPIAHTLKTNADWVSGVYLAKLTTNKGSVGFINFVVRQDNVEADILYQLPVSTYQAYNNWGGKSLYDYNSQNTRANKVSFDRPYAASYGAGQFFDGEYNMVRWLEKEGYDVTYITSLDLEDNSKITNGRKVFLSNWHDEYWSKNMRDNVTEARDNGVDLAFFSANNMYFQIRYEQSFENVPNRIMVCYKDANLDSAAEPYLSTVKWRDQPVNKPENELLGIMYSGDVEWGTSAPWIVNNSDHWVYKNTKLKDEDKIDGLVGYEYDSYFDNGLASSNIQLLSKSPIIGNTGQVDANSSIYTAKSGALVFSAGTIYWPWKLEDNNVVSRGVDKRVQRMTKNILNAMISNNI